MRVFALLRTINGEQHIPDHFVIPELTGGEYA